MNSLLATEIQQRKPFAGPEEEAYLNLMRSADALRGAAERLLKPAGLSQSAYNVLRILRGSQPDGLPCREVAARLVSRDPDLTRLVDRLEEAGLVERGRQAGDRRVVRLRIAPAGLALLRRLDGPLGGTLRELFAGLAPEDVERFISTLEALRSRAASISQAQGN